MTAIDPARAGIALIGLRIVVAAVLSAHGRARVVSGGVRPFGDWLDGLAIPFGFAAIYAVGIALVHAPAGWFVVGLGRNGAEYGVILIALLLALAFSHTGKQP